MALTQANPHQILHFHQNDPASVNLENVIKADHHDAMHDLQLKEQQQDIESPLYAATTFEELNL